MSRRLKPTKAGEKFARCIRAMPSLRFSQDVVDFGIARRIKRFRRMRKIEARPDYRLTQMMNEMHCRAFNPLDNADVGKRIIHASVATAVIGVVEKNQVARAGIGFDDRAIFLHVAINRFHVVF